MTSERDRPRRRLVLRVDPLLHRLIAPIVAGLSLLAFVVLSIAAASLVSHAARKESARTPPPGPGATRSSARAVGQDRQASSERSR